MMSMTFSEKFYSPLGDNIRRCRLFAPVFLFSACAAVGPNFKSPENNLPADYRWDASKNGRSAAQRDGWWTVFDDSGLNRIIGQVRTNNHDLRAGLKRYDQARAVIGVSRAGALPQVAVTPSGSRQRISEESVNGRGGTFSTYNLPASVDWEIDLFGRIRRGVEAAQADAQASGEDLNNLRLTLETEAATRYFTMRALDQEIGIVQEGVGSRKNSLKLAQDRKNLGVVSELDVAQAQTLLATSEADLQGLRRERAAQEAALAVLAGQPASNFRIAAKGLAGSPPNLPSGFPSELARARPDIRRAERNLAAENARVGVATAAFYPSISLTGSLGVQSSDIGNLLNGGARFWAISPQAYIPIFQGGRNKANLARSQSRYEEVLENYQQTVLEALSEVETALAARAFYDGQSAALARASTAAERTREIANDQYQGGTSNYLNVLDAERTALDAKRQQALIRGADYVNTVNLIKALGGRW